MHTLGRLEFNVPGQCPLEYGHSHTHTPFRGVFARAIEFFRRLADCCSLGNDSARPIRSRRRQTLGGQSVQSKHCVCVCVACTGVVGVLLLLPPSPPSTIMIVWWNQSIRALFARLSCVNCVVCYINRSSW